VSSPKVAFYGQVSMPGGYGTAARAYVKALYSSGVDISVIDLTPCKIIHDSVTSSLLNRKMVPDVHLFHHYQPQSALPLSLAFERVIFLTAWETDTLREDSIELFNQVGEVWVPCRYNYITFSNALSVPIFMWPHVYRSRLASNYPTLMNHLPTLDDSDFLFYSICAAATRKYPEGIIEAFLRAFRGDEGVTLIIKTVYCPADHGALLQRLRERTQSKARVFIVDSLWTEEQMDALAERGNCYVSLHRGEGWCYPLFDAVCRGKEIVATGYSGPLDYLEPTLHNLVQYRLSEVQSRDGWYHAPMNWAEPDLEHAAELMRKVYDSRGSGSRETAQYGSTITTRYSQERVGEMGMKRLQEVLALRSGSSLTSSSVHKDRDDFTVQRSGLTGSTELSPRCDRGSDHMNL